MNKIYNKQDFKPISFNTNYSIDKYGNIYSNKGRGVKKLFCKNWFKSRYDIIYYKQIESVTTMGDECSPVG